MTTSSIIIDFLGEGTAASRPASLTINPAALGIYYATDTMALSLWNGSGWDSFSGGSLPSIANGDILANISGSTATPSGNTLTAILDAVFSAAQGDILYRGATTWAVLAPGTSGNVLTTGGAGANPAWAAGGGGAIQTCGSLLTSSFLASSSAFAWKGAQLIPVQSMTIVGCAATLNIASGSTYQAALVSVAAGPTIGSVIALSTTITASVTGTVSLEFSFPSPGTMSPGTTYGLLIGITSGTGTTVLPLNNPVGFTLSNQFIARCEVPTVTAYRVASNPLAPAQALDTTATGGFPLLVFYR